MRITLPDFLFERAFTFFGKFCIMKNGSCTTGCGSVWLECTAGGREVAGSNPVTPIDHKLDTLNSRQILIKSGLHVDYSAIT